MILQKITKQRVKYSELEPKDQTIVDIEINRIQSMIRLLEKVSDQHTYSIHTSYDLYRLHNYLCHVRKDVDESLKLETDHRVRNHIEERTRMSDCISLEIPVQQQCRESI